MSEMTAGKPCILRFGLDRYDEWCANCQKIAQAVFQPDFELDNMKIKDGMSKHPCARRFDEVKE